MRRGAVRDLVGTRRESPKLRSRVRDVTHTRVKSHTRISRLRIAVATQYKWNILHLDTNYYVSSRDGAIAFRDGSAQTFIFGGGHPVRRSDFW